MIIVAIDGPSASGKGTIARKLARHLDFSYLDTGLLYRAVGMAVIQSGGDPSDYALAERAALDLNAVKIGLLTEDLRLRTDEASQAASKVASIPAVRSALFQFQKSFCDRPPGGKAGAVLDGRDIGTVIAPQARVKIFVTASAKARAERRYHELRSRDEKVTLEEVYDDMIKRDSRDVERAIAPTKPALDAVILDTTLLTADEAVAQAIAITERKLT